MQEWFVLFREKSIVSEFTPFPTALPGEKP